MKKYVKFGLLMVLIVGFTGCNRAQDRPGMGGQRNMDPEQMMKAQVDRMTEALELSDEQKAEVTTLFEEMNKKQRETRENNAGDREAMRSAMQEIGQEREKGLREILSEEQWTKWQEVREEFRQRRGQRRGAGT